MTGAVFTGLTAGLAGCAAATTALRFGVRLGMGGIDRRGDEQRGEDAGKKRRQKRRRTIFRTERRDGGGKDRDDEDGPAGERHMRDARMEDAGHHEGADTDRRHGRQQDRQHQNTQ